MKITFWGNGTVTALDENSKQIPTLEQHSWLGVWLEAMERQGYDPTIATFELPGGRHIRPFRISGHRWNWEIIA